MTAPREPGVRVLASRTLHAGGIFELVAERVRLPSGREQALDVVRHPGAVAIAALDEEGGLVLVRQYRHSLARETVEIPAGRLEDGEQPLGAAQRELEEETGLAADDWRLLRVLVAAPGFCSERIWLYLAEGLRALPDGGRPADPDEEIAVLRRAPAELVAGEVEDAKTLVAALLILAGAGRSSRS